MSKTTGYEAKPAIPNKMIQDDGTITDLMGNTISATTEVYDSKKALPNKFLNPNGSYSTLQEILAESIDTDIFIIVTELPEVGEENKIYLVPKDGGTGFVEWVYADGQWDTVGELEIDLSDYKKTYFWNGTKSAANLELWQNIYRESRTEVIMVVCIRTSSGSGMPAITVLGPSSFPPDYTNLTIYWSIPLDIGGKTDVNGGCNTIRVATSTLTRDIETDTITAMSNMTVVSDAAFRFLPTNPPQENSIDFTPTLDMHPATKKYVDDNSTPPQVFYWDGVRATTDFSFWNNILEVLKTSPVIVFRYVTKTNRKYVLSWYFHNTLPTAWTEDSSYAGVTSIGGTTSSGHMVGYKCTQYLYFTITDGVVTGMADTNPQEITINYLDTRVDMGSGYTPQYDSSPANKKYVDDSINNSILTALGGSY